MSKLLVSVRSAAEAEAALAGGARLIDVKEPAQGSLGRAPEQVVAEVLRTVAGRVPVSAALGELVDGPGTPFRAVRGLAFAKWGLAGLASLAVLDRAAGRLHNDIRGCRLVTVAYADFKRARALQPAEILAHALERRYGPFLLDTFAKDGRTLLDHLTLSKIVHFCRLCRDAEMPIALAGSLGPREIYLLDTARPTWFAVRGAVCAGGVRGATIDVHKVRNLVHLLERHGALSIPGS